MAKTTLHMAAYESSIKMNNTTASTPPVIEEDEDKVLLVFCDAPRTTFAQDQEAAVLVAEGNSREDVCLNEILSSICELKTTTR